MLLYLTLTSIGLIGFWLYYYLFLRRTTFFNMNRWYFIVTIIFCCLIPLTYHQVVIDKDIYPSSEAPLLFYSQSIGDQVQELQEEIEQIEVGAPNQLPWLRIIYLTIGGMLLLRLLLSIYTVRNLTIGAEMVRYGNYKVYYSQRIKQPFTLFRSIYMPSKHFNDSSSEILKHEGEHIAQYHFIDLILIELASILLWFNPVVYLYKISMRLNLEYLADRAVINKGANVLQYQSLLLSNVLEGNYNSALTTNFTSPLKNRIDMMKKGKTQKWMKFSIIGALPIAVLLVAMNTRTELNEPITQNIVPIMEQLQLSNKPSRMPLDEDKIEKVTSGFGKRIHPISKEELLHRGIDLVAKEGTPVYATANGQVVIAKVHGELGNYVQIRHSMTYSTQYNHLSSYTVFQNQLVKKGDLIGYVGNTGLSMGPHLHYEVHVDGEPVDPKEFMDGC